MNRRFLLVGLVSSLFTTGCVDLESQGFQADDEESSNDDTSDEVDDENGTSVLADALSDADVEVLEIASDGEVISLRIQTRGNIDEDVNRVASVYSSVSESLSAALSLVIEDRGLTQEEFFIEHEWALDHANGRLSDQAYLEKIRNEEDD